jgi:hypothetical protein
VIDPNEPELASVLEILHFCHAAEVYTKSVSLEYFEPQDVAEKQSNVAFM